MRDEIDLCEANRNMHSLACLVCGNKKGMNLFIIAFIKFITITADAYFFLNLTLLEA